VANFKRVRLDGFQQDILPMLHFRAGEQRQADQFVDTRNI
jgi:hypothetical protein